MWVHQAPSRWSPHAPSSARAALHIHMCDSAVLRAEQYDILREVHDHTQIYTRSGSGSGAVLHWQFHLDLSHFGRSRVRAFRKHSVITCPVKHKRCRQRPVFGWLTAGTKAVQTGLLALPIVGLIRDWLPPHRQRLVGRQPPHVV